MQISGHILATEGILSSFAIAKRVSSADINKLRNKIKKSAPSNATEDTIEDLLREAILEDSQNSIMNEDIPGLLFKKDAKEDKNKRMMELTFFASLIAKKMKEKNIDKYQSCYIINAIVNMLGLTEGDFDDFHDKFKDGGKSDDSVE